MIVVPAVRCHPETVRWQELKPVVSWVGPVEQDRPREAGRWILGAERDALRAELAEHYRQGASIRELAGLVGRSYGFVHQLLRESGVPLRPRTQRPGRTPRPRR